MQAQAERVEHRQHLGESNRGLATLQLNEKTNSDGTADPSESAYFLRPAVQLRITVSAGRVG